MVGSAQCSEVSEVIEEYIINRLQRHRRTTCCNIVCTCRRWQEKACSPPFHRLFMAGGKPAASRAHAAATVVAAAYRLAWLQEIFIQ